MNGFERRKEEKKEAVRRAALELFEAYGPRKVSVNEVARKAGVSPVTIYNHFGSKQGLVRAVVRQMLETNLAGFREIVTGSQPYMERLRQIFLFKQDRLRTLHSEMLQAVLSEDPEIRQFVTDLLERRLYDMMLSFFDEGKSEGYINPDLSNEAILLYMEMFRAFAYTSPDLYARFQSEPQLLNDTWHLFLYGLMDERKVPGRRE
jgi:AcrR family transcriptional regulator